VTRRSAADPLSDLVSAALQRQLAELQATVAQKDALIAELQPAEESELQPGPQKDRLAPMSRSRASMPPSPRVPSPLSPRVRTSSLEEVLSDGRSSPELQAGAASSLRTGAASPLAGSPRPLAGFRAPTIASEARSQARRVSAANGDAPQGSPSGASGKVIQQLTAELATTRETLDATRVTLRTAQRSATAGQRTLDETKAALIRSRAENEHAATMLARKDRTVADALERARKAEAEAKELGRASREWGARVREVEAELGEERRRKQKAEAGYEAISAAWKTTRDAWRTEIAAAKGEVAARIAEGRAEVDAMRALFDQAKHEWRSRETEQASLDETLARLQAERSKAEEVVGTQVRELVERLVAHEAETRGQEETLRQCEQDVQRMIRLARQGDVAADVA
jgi:hypothetical protein